MKKTIVDFLKIKTKDMMNVLNTHTHTHTWDAGVVAASRGSKEYI
jgi:hypothetical protein